MGDLTLLCYLIPPCFYSSVSQFIKFLVYYMESSDPVKPLEFIGTSFGATSCAKVNNETFKNMCHRLVLGNFANNLPLAQQFGFQHCPVSSCL